tara:strand:- start:9063 stop:9272 length:210 start_codon:yes stop_codon:yes gene_type:complete
VTTKNKEKKSVEIELSLEQKNMQAHINSLTKKIQAHQFEIEELVPSLRTFEKSFTNSLQSSVEDTKKEE